MNTRPLLDYLTDAEDLEGRTSLSAPEQVVASADIDRSALERRLKELEARLAATPERPADDELQDLTLSAQVEAILNRRTAGHAGSAAQARSGDGVPLPQRVSVDPPPTAPTAFQSAGSDEIPDFLKFTEAVYLIGQAAKRFIETPAPALQPVHAVKASPAVEIDTLAAVLRETLSALRYVADDLAVSAGEIRRFATREEGAVPARRSRSARTHDRGDEIARLQEAVARLNDRLDGLVHMRRY